MYVCMYACMHVYVCHVEVVLTIAIFVYVPKIRRGVLVAYSTQRYTELKHVFEPTKIQLAFTGYYQTLFYVSTRPISGGQATLAAQHICPSLHLRARCKAKYKLHLTAAKQCPTN